VRLEPIIGVAKAQPYTDPQRSERTLGRDHPRLRAARDSRKLPRDPPGRLAASGNGRNQICSASGTVTSTASPRAHLREGPPIFRAPRPARLASGLRGFGLVDPQDLNRRRGGENFAEGVHPALRVLSRASSPATELVELIEAC
jgi:hypothetical protein